MYFISNRVCIVILYINDAKHHHHQYTTELRIAKTIVDVFILKSSHFEIHFLITMKTNEREIKYD